MCEGAEKKRPRRQQPPGPTGHSPALVWVSLVGLLASSARLRFARQNQYIATRDDENRCILRRFRLKIELLNQLSRRKSPQDATKDYPQSGPTFQVLRLRKNPTRGGKRKNDAGS